jgi:hypothetical protein
LATALHPIRLVYLIETCKLNGIDPQRYLHYVLERIADHPINRIHELLPWNVVTKLNQPAAVPEAMAANAGLSLCASIALSATADMPPEAYFIN